MTGAMELSDPTGHTGPTALRPHGLLRRTHRPTRAGMSAAVAEHVIRRLLDRMVADRLTVVEAGNRHAYGPDEPPRGSGLEPLRASLTVHDRRAWTAVATEGSVGLGRGYLEGWWTSDDPTTLVRVLIRNLRPLDDLRDRLDRVGGPLGDQLRRLRHRPDRARNRDDIASHYDLGNEFFALFLDDTMTYSAGVFTDDDTPLHQASLAKYDRLLDKLGVGPDHHVLEIGTGWGGFALRAATRGCRVTTTTISAEQHREATARIGRAGLSDRVTVLNRDWRDLSGAYDRIVSIEMIEAVDWRDYDRFFTVLDRCLRPDGLMGLQAICVPDRRWNRVKDTEDFIRRFVFPGGQLPSVGAVGRSVAAATRLQLTDLEDLSAHYAETLLRWRHRFDERSDEARGLGLDDRFLRLWRFYLAYCEAAFAERHCTVTQVVLAGPHWRPDGLSLRPA